MKKIKDRLWCELGDLNVYQLLKLEDILKTLNNENNEWHSLYGQNSRLKTLFQRILK